MVNASLNFISLFGLLIFLFGGICLTTKFIKIHYSLSFMIAGFIFFFQGWRLDPISQFGINIIIISLFNELITTYLINQKSKSPSFNSVDGDGDGDEDEDYLYKKDNSVYWETDEDWSNKIPRTKISQNEVYEKEEETIFHRNIGNYEPEDLYLMNDDEIYEKVKFQLQLLTTGKKISQPGEVEYLKDLLKYFRK